jgi:cytochrome b6
MVDEEVRKAASWLETRLMVGSIVRYWAAKTIPRGKRSIWYLFGGIALFFFIVQIITGALLSIYYSPTPESANESVHLIVDRVAFGWLVRSVHSWSSHLMIGSLVVHFFAAYFMRAYRKPREVTWLTGIVLLMLVLGFGFTGYLLPWDGVAYSGTQVGTEIPKAIPIVGSIAVKLLRGGEVVAAETLKRLYALHVVILPLGSILILLIHLMLVQLHGVSTLDRFDGERGGMSFYPDYLYRDLLAWIVASILLVSLCMLFPAHVGPKADILASPPAGIKPEWYFLPLFETLRIVPAQLFGLGGEFLVSLSMFLVGIGLIALPIIDRSEARGKRGVILAALGIAAICYIIVSISLALLT